MASYVEEVGIRLRADGVIETGSGITLTGKSLDDLQKKAAAAGKQMDGFTASSRQTQNALRQLPAQITDVVTSLASGQKPWMVFIQQGGQIKDSFGGIVPAAKAVLSAVNPIGVAFGVVGAAAGVLGMAFYNGWQQSRELNNALALTGNTAGVTAGQFNSLVRSVAASSAAGASDVRDLMQTLVASGTLAVNTLKETSQAVLALTRLNGQSAADNAKAFNGMRDGVAAWAAKANASYNYLTAEQYKQIRSLEEQGRVSEAVRLNMQALTSTLESRTAPALGYIERAAKAASKGWKDFWDSAYDVGRPDDLDKKLDKAKTKLEQAKQRPKDEKPQYNPLTGRMMPGSQQQEDAAQGEVYALNREAARAADRAGATALAAFEEQQKIQRASREFKDSELALDAARNAKDEAATQLSLQQRTTALEAAYRRWAISGETYRDRRIAIATEEIDAQEKLARQAIAIEESRVIATEGGPAQVEARKNQKDAAIAQAQAQLLQVQRARAQLKADIDAGQFDPKGREVIDTPREAFRRAELEGNGNRVGTEALQQRLNDSKTAAQELLATNKTLSAELILDERKRAEALLDIEAQQLRERLALNVGSVEERQAKEEAFAQWMVLRQRKLNQDLRPEWERMLDDWQDTQRMMREASDYTFTAFLKNGEDAFVQLVTTGKISAGNLVNAWISEMARVEFRRAMSAIYKAGGGSGGFGGFFSGIGNLLSASTGGGAGFGTGSAYGNQDIGEFLHSGGLAGSEPTFTRTLASSTWAGAPRFHGGGLASDEVPAVLRKGEGVFTQGQMRNLAPVDQLAAAAKPSITYAPTFNVDSRTDRAEVLSAMQRMTKASQAELLEMMDRRMV